MEALYTTLELKREMLLSTKQRSYCDGHPSCFVCLFVCLFVCCFVLGFRQLSFKSPINLKTGFYYTMAVLFIYLLLFFQSILRFSSYPKLRIWSIGENNTCLETLLLWKKEKKKETVSAIRRHIPTVKFYKLLGQMEI